jgi:hypothetical protein
VTEKEKLLAKIAAIEADPNNLNPPGSSLFIYKPAARKRLEKLARDITDIIRQEKLARGETINDEGYSGRQSKRR